MKSTSNEKEELNKKKKTVEIAGNIKNLYDLHNKEEEEAGIEK